MATETSASRKHILILVVALSPLMSLALEPPASEIEAPSISWNNSTPDAVDLDPRALAELGTSLAGQGTDALLISRRGMLAHEWYSPDFGPNQKRGLAAMSKGVVASPLLLKILQETGIELDASAAAFLPAWQADERKSEITLRHLASHSSGLADVDFSRGHTGWKKEYLDNPDRRFRLAIERTPLLYDPGTRLSYSGVGFYALAYALGEILHLSADGADLLSYYDEQIMTPLGIPRNAWSISYGESYDVAGVRLSAIGSGAALTARGAARVGELFLARGTWGNRAIIHERWVDEAFKQTAEEKTPERPRPAAGLGWWLNTSGFSESLPQDAVVAVGGSHQILLVIPSLELVAVRFGELLRSGSGDPYWSPMEEQLFRPLMDAVISRKRTEL